MSAADEHHSPVFNTLIATAAFVVTVAGVYAARIIVIPFLLAIFIAVILSAILSWLQDRKIKTGIAVTLMILILGVIGSATLFVVGASVNELIRRLPEINEAVQIQESKLNGWLEEHNFMDAMRDKSESKGQSLEVFVPGLVPAPEKNETPPRTTDSPENQANDDGAPGNSKPQPKPSTPATETSPDPENSAAPPENMRTAPPEIQPNTDAPATESDANPNQTGDDSPATETSSTTQPEDSATSAEQTEQDTSAPTTNRTSEETATDDTPPVPDDQPAPARIAVEDIEIAPPSRFELPYSNYMFGPQKLIIEVPASTAGPQVKSRYGGYFSPVEIFRWFLESVWGISNYALIVFLMLMFLLLEWSHFGRKLEALPGNTQSYIEQVTEILSSIRQYMLIKTLVSILTGLLVTIWLMILGTDYAALWGTVAFLFNYIPTIGSIIAGVVPSLFVLIDQGPLAALNVSIAFLVVNFVIGNILEPRIMGEGLGLSTFVVFVSLVFWGFILGPAGMLVAVPLTMAIKIALASDERTKWMSSLLGSGKVLKPGPPKILELSSPQESSPPTDPA